jgi:rubrerythrin
MTLAVGIILIVAVAIFVAAPFFSGEDSAVTVRSTGRRSADRQKLETLKVEAYGAIKEAEFDHRMGKLTDADFAMLRDKYTRQAIDVIAALEDATAEPRRLADARASARGSRSASRPAAARSTRVAFCPTCGCSLGTRANFCPSCGRSLKEEVA